MRLLAHASQTIGESNSDRPSVGEDVGPVPGRLRKDRFLASLHNQVLEAGDVVDLSAERISSASHFLSSSIFVLLSCLWDCPLADVYSLAVGLHSTPHV